MRVGFGLITCQRHPGDTRSDADVYREAVELSVLAEKSGFDSVWTSEHHFLDDGYMPSLLVLSAAIAQATQRITIGTGVLLAPLHHPLRLAEDAATVQLLSGGRLVLGIGAGWRPEEFEVLGVPLGERASRLRETVAILRGAWGPGAFSHEGRHWRLDRVNVTPKPHVPIPLWIGGFAEPAIRRAGRIADGFLGSSSGTSGIDGFRRAHKLAMEGLRQAGRDPSDFRFGLHVPVFAWDEGDAWELVKPWYHYLRWKYPDMGAARGSDTAASPPPLTADEEAQLRSTIICGTPEQVVEELKQFRDALGDDVHFICRSYFSGMPLDVQSRAVEIIGSRVIPALRS
ncbi:MAG TPA: LLM class flavin-dependent oxidoreductase [Actinomycetota bacterium]|nr:LLM class flavin-dependent oxidoreductase [Actinomycetota bacterium]